MSTKNSDDSYRRERNEIRKRLHDAQGSLNYLLEVFGDELSVREGWKSDLEGIEAVHFYLMQKHHWTPSQVRSMTYDDLRFALREEMHGWTAPRGTP